MKRKILIVLVVWCFVIALVSACSSAPQQSPSPTSQVSSEPPATSTPESTPSPADSSAEKAPSPEPSADSSAIVSKDRAKRGTWANSVYTNDFAKLSYTLPAGWVVATDEEIAAMMGIATDILNDEQKWIYESSKMMALYDTAISDPSTGNNIVVMYNNLSMIPGGTSLTVQDYMAATEQQLSALDSMSYFFEEPFETTLGGETYLSEKVYEESFGLSQYYFMRIQSEYLICLIVTVMDGSDISDIMQNFG